MMLNKTDEQAFIEKYCFTPNGAKDKNLAKTFEISIDCVKEAHKNLKPEIAKIQEIKRRFNGQRKKDFEERGEDVKSFCEWFKQQKECCHYCGITQGELYKLFTKDDNKILPLNDAKKRDSGTLEIDKKNPSKEYIQSNMVLACPLCNNAKSNLIDADSWKELFANGMKKYYQTLLSKVKK